MDYLSTELVTDKYPIFYFNDSYYVTAWFLLFYIATLLIAIIVK